MDFYLQEDDLNAIVIQKLHRRRLELGISPETTAEFIGVSLQKFLSYKRGDAPLPAVHLYPISLLYGVSPSYFFEENDGESYNPEGFDEHS